MLFIMDEKYIVTWFNDYIRVYSVKSRKENPVHIVFIAFAKVEVNLFHTQ